MAYKIVVLKQTDERTEPHIRAEKTGKIFTPGTTWLTEKIFERVFGVDVWVMTPSGNWTAALYPVDGDENNIKEYCSITLLSEESSQQYNPNDKLIRYVNGVPSGEYHRWIP